MDQTRSDQFPKWLRPRRQHRVLIDYVARNQAEHRVDLFSKFRWIGDISHIVASSSPDGSVSFLKTVAFQRNDVVLRRFAVVENLRNPTRNDQIVIAKQPNVFPARLFKALQKVRVRPNVLSIPDVANLQPAVNEVLYDGWSLVRGSIIRDDHLNPTLVLELINENR